MRTGSRWCLACGLLAALCMWPAHGRAQVTVNFIWHQPDMQTFYVADFIDLAQEAVDTSLHPDLFTVILTNIAGVDQEISVKVTLKIQNLSILQLSDSDLAWVQSKVFTLEPQGLQINNRDLSQEGQKYSIDTGKSGYDETTAEALQDIILQTGLLPSGNYKFEIQVLDVTDQPILSAYTEHTIFVSNPTRVDLVGPGTEFGGALPVIATNTPQFFWSTDAIASGLHYKFRIRVVKVEGAASAEEAMQGFAVWEKFVENQTTEIYPSSVEAIALEAGETYAWQVERLVETSSGTHEIWSEIFWFRLEDPTAGIIGAGIEEEVSQMVDQIQDLQGVAGELEGYQPTGQVLVDGKPMDLNALRNLLEQVLSGQIQIITIIIR
ncbi:MAG: hypothetical protein KAT18_05440 [Candidatus Latescibacteria bacterium]|nr:hypothetical protein [Candidatus Latescibacterota bacterium]